MSTEKSNDIIGIEPTTFWLVAQCLNDYATACPIATISNGTTRNMWKNVPPFYFHTFQTKQNFRDTWDKSVQRETSRS
jgi:hypothetical protein